MIDTTFTLPTLHFLTAERLLLEEALLRGGSIVEASKLLGLTRHATKRRIIKHGIRWDRERGDGVVGE